MANKSYDGYYKYNQEVAQSYDLSRMNERHWKLEDQFVEEYLRKRQVKDLLDVPVGTGRFLHHYNGIQNVVGVDVSEEMLKRAKERLTSHMKASIHIEQGDVFNLRFIDSAFDTVIVFRLLHLLPEASLSPAIKEICRVSRNDILVQTYASGKEKKYKNYLYIPAAFKRLVSFLRKRMPFLNADHENKPWSHIHSYFHEQSILDEIFASYGFFPSDSKLLDIYGKSEVRATIYSKKN